MATANKTTQHGEGQNPDGRYLQIYKYVSTDICSVL